MYKIQPTKDAEELKIYGKEVFGFLLQNPWWGEGRGPWCYRAEYSTYVFFWRSCFTTYLTLPCIDFKVFVVIYNYKNVSLNCFPENRRRDRHRHLLQNSRRIFRKNILSVRVDHWPVRFCLNTFYNHFINKFSIQVCFSFENW